MTTKLVNALRNSADYFGTDLRGSYLVTQQVVFTSTSVARATSCWFDAGLILGPDGPDGKPTVIDDSITSSTMVHTLYLKSGRWLVGEETQIAQLGDGDLCRAG
jgi:hypothetical protein